MYSANEFIHKVNDYWQIEHRKQIPRSFWEQSAYHIGNLAAYNQLLNPSYLKFTRDWADANHWRGHPSMENSKHWTWAYGEEDSNAVLFADWHVCYQVYLELSQFIKLDHKKMLSNMKKVINYQLNTLEDSYWWWSDGLFMGMPLLSKLYRHTEEAYYLTKMHEYFLFSLELMYDGENGIPINKEGYTSSAYYGGPYGGKAATTSDYSNPNDYKHLFYRDASFCYPQNPLPGELSVVKNFWSRGNGWVVAALVKVLRDIPREWAHYNFYLRIFKQMMSALKECYKKDSEGRIFWTQSLLSPNYSCSDENIEGYETSGTAFFLFGMIAGINDGLLEEDEYLLIVEKGWRYLTEVALHENGKIGFVQPVGAVASSAATYENTQDFGVGACLLTASEMSKWQERKYNLNATQRMDNNNG